VQSQFFTHFFPVKKPFSYSTTQVVLASLQFSSPLSVQNSKPGETFGTQTPPSSALPML